MIKNLKANKVYNLYEVLGIKEHKPLWKVRMEIWDRIRCIKAKKVFDKYEIQYGYGEYDLNKCNIDNMPEFISVDEGEYNPGIVKQLETDGIIHCTFTHSRYKRFVCRHKDYRMVCNRLNLEMYDSWEYDEKLANRHNISKDDWYRWSIVCGTHDGLWDNIGDLVDDKQYRRNEYKRDAVIHIVVNYIVENMDRFINYFFKYDEYEAIERMYFDSKKELGIK